MCCAPAAGMQCWDLAQARAAPPPHNFSHCSASHLARPACTSLAARRRQPARPVPRSDTTRPRGSFPPPPSPGSSAPEGPYGEAVLQAHGPARSPAGRRVSQAPARAAVRPPPCPARGRGRRWWRGGPGGGRGRGWAEVLCGGSACRARAARGPSTESFSSLEHFIHNLCSYLDLVVTETVSHG